MGGIIYVWKYRGNVKYVGRTIQGLSKRTNQHVLTYKNQKKNGLTTKKFIEISKLRNEWNDIEIETIEHVEDIATLGNRELYWYNFYNDKGSLWNSILPDNSDYLVLSEKMKIERKTTNLIFDFIHNEITNAYYRIIHNVNDELWKGYYEELVPGHYFPRRMDSYTNVNELVQVGIDEFKHKPWFSLLIEHVINCKEEFESKVYSQALTSYYLDLDIDILLDNYECFVNQVTIDDIVEYYKVNNTVKYLSKSDKIKDKINRNNAILNFHDDFFHTLSKMPKKYSRDSLFDMFENKFLKFLKDYPDYVSKLITYLRGKNIGGGKEYNLLTNDFNIISAQFREHIFSKYVFKIGIPDPREKEAYELYQARLNGSYNYFTNGERPKDIQAYLKRMEKMNNPGWFTRVTDWIFNKIFRY